IAKCPEKFPRTPQGASGSKEIRIGIKAMKETKDFTKDMNLTSLVRLKCSLK
ncbi:unnamed protein product, partial [Allacma fusca]